MKNLNEFQWNSFQYLKTAGMQETYGVQLLSKIPLKDNSIVLDAGCGAGNLTFKIAKRILNGHVTGIDLSDSMILKCKADAERLNIKNVSFYVCGLNDITYEKKFNIIYSNSVLHWIKNVTDACKRMYTALCPGGRIGLQFPLLNTSHPLVSLANDTIRQLNLQSYYTDWEFPWYVSDKEEFKNMLISAGFVNVMVIEESTQYEFDSYEIAYSFFRSVGLTLYYDALPDDKRKNFEKAFYANILKASEKKAKFTFHRLFAYAQR